MLTCAVHGQAPSQPELLSIVSKEFQGGSYARLRGRVSTPIVLFQKGNLVVSTRAIISLTETEKTETERELRSMTSSALGQAKIDDWQRLIDNLRIEILDINGGPGVDTNWLKVAIVEESNSSSYADLRSKYDFINSKYNVDSAGRFNWGIKPLSESNTQIDIAGLRKLLSTAVGQRRDAPAGLNIANFANQAVIELEKSERKIAEVSIPLEGVFAEYFGSGVHAYFAHAYNHAQEIFGELVDLGVQDARLMFFVGLAQYQLGMQDSASAMFVIAADLEATGKSNRDLGKSLERIQGPVRTEIEHARLMARSSRTK